jgi:dTDP-4-dehydrorhamnose reductase
VGPEKDRMMILITGSGGRVGRSLEAALQRRFPDRVVAATREELDLRDPARVAMEMERFDPQPTVTINCAALTDPHLAESAPEESLEANRAGVASLARACRELESRLIHLSTVDVFSGTSSAPYREEDATDAATQYGKIRHLGELAAAEENPDHLVLRMSMLCGDFEAGDPLLAIQRALETGESLAWYDRRVTPLWMEDLGSAFQTILRTDWKGVLHLGNGGPCLLSEIVDEMAQLLGSPRVPELIGGMGPASFWEGSGRNAALDTSRFIRLSGRRPREWRQALRAMKGLKEKI